MVPHAWNEGDKEITLRRCEAEEADANWRWRNRGCRFSWLHLTQLTREINQWCFNVGPASKTVAQHWNIIGRMHMIASKTTQGVVQWLPNVKSLMRYRPYYRCSVRYPANTRLWANVGPTLTQHWVRVSCLLGMHTAPPATLSPIFIT